MKSPGNFNWWFGIIFGVASIVLSFLNETFTHSELLKVYEPLLKLGNIKKIILICGS